MKKVLFLLLCLFYYPAVAQDTPTPTEEVVNPKEQPLDKPTIAKDGKLVEKQPAPTPSSLTSAVGSLPAGQTPTQSPESNFINRFQDIPVNLFTGTPTIGFPIYTLSESGGSAVPISLSYNASGMKAHDVAGWTGMNWVLSAGGQITRIVRGIPDEGKMRLDNDLVPIPQKGFYMHGVHADNDDENDGQADLFFLNINGASYKFSFDANKKAHFYPEADINVTVDWTPIEGTSAGLFSNWIVTMPDGSKYYFPGTNAYDISFELEANQVTSFSEYEFGVYAKYQQLINTFYLTKIETAFGHQTLFEYHPTGYSFFKLAEQEATTYNCTFSNVEKKINRVYVYSSTLYKITNNTMVVEFNKGGWTQGVDRYNRAYWYLNSTYPARNDLEDFSRTITNSSSTRALYKISVYGKDNPNKTLEWNFTYDYNYGTDQYNTPPFGYTFGTVGYTHQRRFKLRSIQEPDGNKYRFAYYDDTFPLPSRFNQGVDHWGYLNGALGSTLLIGQDAYRNCANGQAANRSATVGWSQYGTLTSISHSTGGTTFLEYENHTARNYTPTIGGSRIKKITYLDSISTLKTVKKYDYLQANGTTSSGFLCLKPVYHFDDKVNLSSPRNQYWYSGLYQQLLAESGRPAVGYSRVKETILSGNELETLGYSVSEFLQPLSEINIQETILTNCRYDYTRNPPLYVCDTIGVFTRPYKWIPFHENTVGVPTKIAVYGSNNSLLSEKSSVYQETYLSNPQFNYRSFRLVNQNYNFANTYNDYYTTYRLKSDTTKTFSQDGTNPIITINKYDYKEDMDATYLQQYAGKHHQVVRTRSTDSYGNTHENWVKYAADFKLGSTIPSNPEAKGIYQLQQKHIVNAVVESIARKQDNVAGTNTTLVVNASYQSYYDKDSATFKAGLPKASYALENVPRSSFTEVAYDTTTQTFTKSTDYDLKATVNAYTTIGLPVLTSTRFATQTKTNYDATYPNLPISQTTNLGQASEQTTSMEYASLLYGVSKQTGANGLSVSSEFYPDGKLKQQTDKDGNVLKHIQYVYRGQADNDPLLTTYTGYNRVITRIPRIASTAPLSLDYDQCAISVVYLDGLGRTVQQLSYKASPNKKDLVGGLTEYDVFNRPLKSWLSVEANQASGNLVDSAQVKLVARAFYQDVSPYSEVAQYESSPLSRIFKSYGVGKVWRDSSKYTQVRYETATGIKKFMLDASSTTVSIESYSGYQLSKLISSDERGSRVIEYKDKAGNTIQREVEVTTDTYLTTAYIYDNAGRLRYILPPKAYNALGNASSLTIETWANFNENVYAYHYDGRGRVYESHIPAVGWKRVVFNRLNQAVMSQDEDELARANTWNYVQSDGQGRSIRTGQMQLPANYTPASLQSLFDNFLDANQFEERTTTAGQYTNRSFPSALRTYVTDASLKSINYYDDYSWRTNNPYSGSVTDYAFQTNPFNTSAYSVNNAKGLMTGGYYKEDGFGDFWFPKVVYYDDKNRTIQSIIYQDLYARNQSDVLYNFVGDVLQNRMIYRKSGTSDYIRTTETILDHTGRTKEVYYTLKEGSLDKVARFKMKSYAYDAIGRLASKDIQPTSAGVYSQNSGNWTDPSTWAWGVLPTQSDAVTINTGHFVTVPSNQTVNAGSLYDKGTLYFENNATLQLGSLQAQPTALQTINYSYNVRGGLRGINLDNTGNPSVAADKLFSYKLDYHEDGRYFDGSISKQTWLSKAPLLGAGGLRTYRYSYDRGNRLINAQYAGIGNENYSIANLSYDEMGNIKTMQRYGKTGTSSYGLIDNLNYSYLNNGNRLQKVDDSIAGNIFANDFRDTGVSNDYTYYIDGKIKSDANKGITSIEYNFLNLVSKITFSDGRTVENFYTSSGSKRQRKVTKNGVPSYTIYDGEIVYQHAGTVSSLNDYQISEIQNEEGRFVNGTLEYSYTDHIGNLRLSYKDSSGIAVITQSQSYDPWSNVNAGSEYYLNGNQADKYLVSGKETDSETGNILLDWRDYDSVLGRMHTPDPDGMSGEQISISNYQYSWNNPVSLNDPDGRCPMCIGFMIGVFSGAVSSAISGKMPENIGQFLMPGVQGAIGGGIASAIGGAFAGMGSFAGKGFLQAGAHAISGGVQSAVFGGNFWQGAVSSGISSGMASLSQAAGIGNIGTILSGGLSGGITASLYGGDFWQGAGNGLIIAALNHLGQHEKEESGYGKLYKNETDAYNFMWKNSIKTRIEHSGFLLKEGVFVSKIDGNTDTNGGDDIARYKVRNGILKVNGHKYNILGHIHTHPALDKLGGTNRHYGLSPEDLTFGSILQKPIFAIALNNKVYGYDYLRYEGKEWSPFLNNLKFTTQGLLSGKQSLIKFLQQ